MPLLAQRDRHPPRAVKRRAQVLAVDQRHQLKLVRSDLDRAVAGSVPKAGTGDLAKLPRLVRPSPGVARAQECEPAQQKIAFHRHSSQLFVKLGQLVLAELISAAQVLPEHPGRRLHQRLLPRVNLVGLNPEARRQLRHRRIAAQCCEATLALNPGSCLRRIADISCLLVRLSAGMLRGRSHLSQLSKFRGPLHSVNTMLQGGNKKNDVQHPLDCKRYACSLSLEPLNFPRDAFIARPMMDTKGWV